MNNQSESKGLPAYLTRQPVLNGRADFASRFPGLWMNHSNDGGLIGTRPKQLRYYPRDATDETAKGVVYCGHILREEPYEGDNLSIVVSVETTDDAPVQHPNRDRLRELLAKINRPWIPRPEWGVERVANKFAQGEVMDGEELRVLVRPTNVDERYKGSVGQYWFSFYRAVGHPLSKVLWPT